MVSLQALSFVLVGAQQFSSDKGGNLMYICIGTLQGAPHQQAMGTTANDVSTVGYFKASRCPAFSMFFVRKSEMRLDLECQICCRRKSVFLD